MNQLILASSSPQRKTLLGNAGFSFLTFPVNISETIDKNLSADDEILRLSREKAQASAEQFNCQNFQHDQTLHFLGADTMVFLKGEVLGKPLDFGQARKYLAQLSGGFHEVKTAISVLTMKVESHNETTPTLLRAIKKSSRLVTTKVWFHALTQKQISDYVATGEPMEKAGAYAIQGQGRALVSRIEGSFDNVVGLPVDAVRELLLEHGWKI